MKKRKKKRTQAIRVLEQKRLRQLKVSWFFKISSALLFICVIFWIALKLHDPKFFPIQVVLIEGEAQHIDRNLLRQAIQPFSQSGFFSINMTGLRERLLQFPWVKSVFITREWPDRLHVQVKEQQAKAVWNHNALINEEGELFNAKVDSSSSNLPKLLGPSGEQHHIWQTYATLSNMLARLNLKITELEFTEQQTCSLTLNNTLKLILGQQNAETRLQRFIKAYPALSKKGDAIDYVDLRYGHGMAVKYKEKV